MSAGAAGGGGRIRGEEIPSTLTFEKAFAAFSIDPRVFAALHSKSPTEKDPKKITSPERALKVLSGVKSDEDGLKRTEIANVDLQAHVSVKILTHLFGEHTTEANPDSVPGKSKFADIDAKLRYRLLQEADARATIAEKIGAEDPSPEAIVKKLLAPFKDLPPGAMHRDLRVEFEHALQYIHKTRLSSVLSTLVKELDEESTSCPEPIKKVLISITAKVMAPSREMSMILLPVIHRIPDAGEYSLSHAITFAAEGHLEIVERLLQDDTKERIANTGLFSLSDAIARAAQKGHLEIVERLLQDDTKERIANDGQFSLSDAITSAAEKGHREIVERLLQDDTKEHIANTGEFSLSYAFTRAADEGHLEIVERLLQDDDVKVRIDDTGEFSLSHAITIAAQEGHREIVERLLQDDTKEHIANTGQFSLSHAIARAAEKGHREIVERLRQEQEDTEGDRCCCS